MKWFKDQGWEVHVAAAGKMELPFTDQKFDIPIARSPFNRNNIKAYEQLKKIIDQNDYKMIHCHTPMGGVLARLAARAGQKEWHKGYLYSPWFSFLQGCTISQLATLLSN